jgi:signal transduction histidine kinase
VARELHDGVNQVIASAKMRLGKVAAASSALSPATREILARCNHLLVQALEENRRIAYNLRPSDLDDLGLAIACRNFCKEVQSRTKLAVKCSVTGLPERLPEALELNLFRIAQEAVNNIEKHSQARTASLQIKLADQTVILKVQDDGCGFDAERKKRKGKWSGVGLTNIRERAAVLGGTCEVKSAPKKGTSITVRVPLTHEK